jgi:hypothetical protein
MEATQCMMKRRHCQGKSQSICIEVVPDNEKEKHFCSRWTFYRIPRVYFSSLRGITKPRPLIVSLNGNISFILSPGLFLSVGDLMRLKSPTSNQSASSWICKVWRHEINSKCCYLDVGHKILVDCHSTKSEFLFGKHIAQRKLNHPKLLKLHQIDQ